MNKKINVIETKSLKKLWVKPSITDISKCVILGSGGGGADMQNNNKKSKP